jgi:three-Cys-motif partner protein
MHKNNISEPFPDDWGGDWTRRKADLVVDYAKAYLTVMKDRKYWKLLYFDGFAGGASKTKDAKIEIDTYFSAAIRILEIEGSRTFDMHYLVELDPKNAEDLENHIKQNFPKKEVYVVKEDCNIKLIDLTRYLKSKKGENVKVLAFIDPFGMEVKWESIQILKGLPIDMWILVPTGIGVNRLLKKDGNISEAWLKKLSIFLGMDESEIRSFFYKTRIEYNLFGEDALTQKETNAIEKAAALYKSRLNEIFKHVSNPFLLKNSTGSIMFHFYMATNNPTAFKIANDIVKPKLK